MKFLKLNDQLHDEIDVRGEVGLRDRERLFEMPPRQFGIAGASFDPGQ